MKWPGNMSESEKDRIAWENREKILDFLRKHCPKQMAAAEETVAREARDLADKVAAKLKRELKKPLESCAGAGRNSDGDCFDPRCPQLHDGEPKKTGRHCPLDKIDPLEM